MEERANYLECPAPTGRELLILTKNNQYDAYVKDHIKNVQDSLDKLLEKVYSSGKYEVFIEEQDLLDDIKNRVEWHDQSKLYTEEEFEPYRKHFYPIDEEEKKNSEEEFEAAWKHHYTENDHHWEHWVKENGEADPMPIAAMIEMIADWMAMSFKFGGTVADWYSENKKEINLYPESREYVERIIKTYEL